MRTATKRGASADSLARNIVFGISQRGDLQLILWPARVLADYKAAAASGRGAALFAVLRGR